jgi:hypothetical protein
MAWICSWTSRRICGSSPAVGYVQSTQNLRIADKGQRQRQPLLLSAGQGFESGIGLFASPKARQKVSVPGRGMKSGEQSSASRG